MKFFSQSFALAFALATVACGGGDSVTAPPTRGMLEVTTVTAGAEPDPDGYTLQVNGGAAEVIGPAATWQSAELDPGSYAVQLAGLSANCTVAENPRTVSVTAGETARVAFQVTCSATTGSLQVSVSTTGPAPDADGYVFTVDGADRGALGSSGTLALTGLTPGDHTVGLSGVAGNCQVQGDNPRGVVVTAGASASAAFTVTCAAAPPDAGSLRVTTTTTGPDQDADGYAVALDGGSGQPMGTTAQATLTNLAAGSHSVQLSGVAANCSVEGPNPRSVSVVAGATAEVRFTVTCNATAGSLKVATTTSGVSIDTDGYAVRVDGGNPQHIAVNSTLTVPGVAAGAHTVALEGLSSNCALEGDDSRSVTVAAGTETPVAFVVTCSTPALRWQRMESGTDFLLTGVWGSSPSDVFAIGNHPDERSGAAAIFHYNGQAWSRQHTEEFTGLTSVWGSGPNDVFAVGTGGVNGTILHYDGSGWSHMTGLDLSPPGGQTSLYYSSVWGSSAGDVYAGGTYFDIEENALIAHYDGSSWSKVTLENEDNRNVGDIWGSSRQDVWAVGIFFPRPDASFVLHYDGSQWSEVFTTLERESLKGVWSASPTDVFAVGSEDVPGGGGSRRGLIYHYDGVRWSTMEVPATGGLSDVWGTSDTDVYAVASDAILHYDGARWTKVHDRGGLDVWGSSPTDVFVVGPSGMILHGTP